MNTVDINTYINIRNVGLEYIYTPISLDIKLEGEDLKINTINRLKIVVLIEDIINYYLICIKTKSKDILKEYESFNAFFLEKLNDTLKESELMESVSKILIKIDSVDGITSTTQTIDLK